MAGRAESSLLSCGASRGEGRERGPCKWGPGAQVVRRPRLCARAEARKRQTTVPGFPGVPAGREASPHVSLGLIMVAKMLPRTRERGGICD